MRREIVATSKEQVGGKHALETSKGSLMQNPFPGHFFCEANASLPKILYIGFNRSFYTQVLEPTLQVIAHAGKLERYGPGFSTSSDLEMGIERWAAHRGPYDLIVADEAVFNCENLLKRKDLFATGVRRFPRQQYNQFAPPYHAYFMKYEGPRLLLAMWDNYAISKELTALLSDTNIWVLNYEDASITETIEEVAAKPSIIPFVPFVKANNNWYEFLVNHRDRILSFPHFIQSVDFAYGPLQNRTISFYVPGTAYPERLKAKECLDVRGRMFDLQCSLTRQLVWNCHRTKTQAMLDLYQRTFLNSISRCKACYVSGSSMRVAVRKYFEVPARGTLMICPSCKGFANLGFIHGVNCIVAEDLGAIKAVLSDINDEKYEAIARSGQTLVWEKHSEMARACQFKDDLARILAHRFCGSYWDNGLHKLREIPA
jgi:hypothetical protein